MESALPDIVDCHCHFIRGDVSTGREQGPLPGAYLPDELIRDLSFARLKGLVHVETGAFGEAPWRETAWVSGLITSLNVPAAIIAHADLFADNLSEVLENHRRAGPVRGIRMRIADDYTTLRELSPGDNPFVSRAFNCGYRNLQDFDLLFEAQAPFHLARDLAALAAAFPATPLVLTHLAFPLSMSGADAELWYEHVQVLADQENIIIKLSGVGMLLKGEFDGLEAAIDRLSALFGPKRLMFGSNFPVDIRTDRGEGCRRLVAYVTRHLPSFAPHVLWRNAMKLYGLSDRS